MLDGKLYMGRSVADCPKGAQKWMLKKRCAVVMVAMIGVARSHVIIGGTRDLQLTLVEVSSPPPCHYLRGPV